MMSLLVAELVAAKLTTHSHKLYEPLQQLTLSDVIDRISQLEARFERKQQGR